MEALPGETETLFDDLETYHKHVAFTQTAKAKSKESMGELVELSLL